MLACLLTGGHTFAQPPQPEKYRLLWEVSSPRLQQPSYLFGTMHVTDSRVFDLPDSVLIAIENSAGFALEVDFDSASYLTLQYMYDQHGDAIFDESAWQDNARSWDGNQRPDPAELFKLFDRAAEKEEEVTFLDAFLYRIARENGKTITGLENIVDQLSMLMGRDNTVTDEGDKAATGGKRVRLDEMITVYENGDLDRLDEIVNQGGTTKFFKEEVIIRRNHGMAQRADSLMRIRPTFIGVGAAHLPGKEGVINLLRNAGYTLRPVTATYTGLSKTYREKPYQARWSTFRREGDGYQLEVPTRPFGMDILDGQLKMYLGMDFPGGFVYCFYALSLPEAVEEEKMEEVGKAIVKGFGSHNLDNDATKDIAFKSLKGKEYVVKKDGEHLRVRILFGNGKMYMLLLGNSEQVIFSEAAERWFNSLEVFEPIRMTRQTVHPVRDAMNGFSVDFLGEPDFTAHQVETFAMGGDKNHYYVYENKDVNNRQRMVMLTEDFEDWYAVSKLESRMPDCIRYYAAGDLDPEGDYIPVMTDGVKGLEGTYLGKTGLRYRIRCYIRMNRLYLLGMTLPEDDEDSDVVDRVFSSLHFLPIQQPSLQYTQKEAGLFEATLPGKPYSIANKEIPNGLLGSIDSIWTYYHHDPRSSLNTQVAVGRIWKYFSGSDAELLEAALKTAQRDSGTVLRDEAHADGAWSTHRLVILSHDSTMADHRLWVVTGDHLLEARIQTTHDEAGEATATRFFQQFRPAPNTQKNAHEGKKLQLILEMLEGDDSLAEYKTAFALSIYRLRPDEYGLAFARIRSTADTVPYTLDDQLIELVLGKDDPALQPRLVALYEFLPKESPHRLDIVASLMLREWPGAHAWAVERLHDHPSPLHFRDPSFNWYAHLEEDRARKNDQQLKALIFLLEQPEFAISLASDMARLAYEYEDVDFSAYGEQFSRILSAAIEAYDPESTDYMRNVEMDAVLEFLVRNEVGNWQGLARRMLRLPDTYLAGSAFVALVEQGIELSQKEIKAVMENRYSRGTALSWVLDNGRLHDLPGKYRNTDFIAAVALDMGLEDYPDRVELVEKRKILFQDQQQWLYVYKFAFEGDTDWTLGFSGPFPLSGAPESSYFELSGSNWEEFHPNSYLKKVKQWVSEMDNG